jgi:hypothetical protein
MKKTNVVYKHYRVTGEVEPLHPQEANSRMEVLAKSWDCQSITPGKLYEIAEFDYVLLGLGSGMEAYYPAQNQTEKELLNVKATREFGRTIYGDCFLETRTDLPADSTCK